MAKRVPKASKRRLVFLGPFMLFAAIYFLFTIGYYGYKLVSLKNEQEELSSHLVELQAEEQDLKNEIQKLKDPDYLARYAREHFLYSKDGEYIIRLSKDDVIVPKEVTWLQLVEDNFSKILIGLSILIFAFIIFVFRKNQKSSLKLSK